MGHSLPSCNQATPAAGTGIGSRSTAPCPGTTLEAGAADRWTMAFFPINNWGELRCQQFQFQLQELLMGIPKFVSYCRIPTYSSSYQFKIPVPTIPVPITIPGTIFGNSWNSWICIVPGSSESAVSWPSFCRHITVVSTHIENASVIPMELLDGFPSTRTQTIYAMSIVKLQEKILTLQLYPFLGLRSRKMSHLPSGNLT